MNGFGVQQRRGESDYSYWHPFSRHCSLKANITAIRTRRMTNDEALMIAMNTVLIFIASSSARKSALSSKPNIRRTAISFFLVCFATTYLVAYYVRLLPFDRSVLSAAVSAPIFTLCFYGFRWGWSRSKK
ncbi:hypothetical protein ABE599_04730 [Achromobacter mucicolens]|jgi:hypothetical protein|uniref:hypothetical protein n=1 Tax=Achromobacter mucicolens TaxID=1389922 RepID=UPI0024302504|nr:hypothetical protein [Achromobacter mucicolens]MDF2861150.1 hypothetical protein [Achromobacter mucicolens]